MSSSSINNDDHVPEYDVNLDYFIKFPTPNFKNDATGESDYVFVYNETNVPIIMLLGWAGCQDKYLMKYSKIYEDRGLITIRYSAPVENLFWKRAAMKPIGEKIVKLIHDMNFDSHPIIFHIFSNGGAFLYQHISMAIRNSRKPLKICGFIYDSAPGDRRALSLYRAIYAILSNKPLKTFYSILISLYIYLMWLVEDILAYCKSLINPTMEGIICNPMYTLKDDPILSPQLFLYSKEDLLIPYTDIEHFATHREKLGVNVLRICFEKSEHVKHYIKHPQKYIYYVCKFINDCLSTTYPTYYN